MSIAGWIFASIGAAVLFIVLLALAYSAATERSKAIAGKPYRFEGITDHGRLIAQFDTEFELLNFLKEYPKIDQIGKERIP
jgi:hypothetical protein